MRILVTGATGNIGRKVVDHLLAAGATDVRALTNNPAKAALPPGVDVAQGYLRKLDTLPAALDGVERMYLAPTPDTVTDVLALARDAGVAHVVDLSGEPDNWWGEVAAAVGTSGLDWTHLCPQDFMENTVTWSQQIRATGMVREPYPDATSAPIAMDDIAAVAATALLTDGHAGETYSMTGPESLSRRELVRQLGEALGRDIRFMRVDTEEAIAALEPTMGETAAWYVNTILTAGTEEPTPTFDTVDEVTGKPATTFAEWAASHTAEFTAEP